MRLLLFAIFCLSACSGFSADKAIVRTKFEIGVCRQAVDVGDGSDLKWIQVDFSKCGFDLSKPPRSEKSLVNGVCVYQKVWDSSTGYGQMKMLGSMPEVGLENLRNCGYAVNQPTIAYRLENERRCILTRTIHSDMANMPDIKLLTADKKKDLVDPSNCGFEANNTRTAYEMDDNVCAELQVNFNKTGQRIILSSKKVELLFCGINVAKKPDAVINFKAAQMNLWPGGKQFACTKLETFVSSSGVGIYQRTSKVAHSECEFAPLPKNTTIKKATSSAR